MLNERHEHLLKRVKGEFSRMKSDLQAHDSTFESKMAFIWPFRGMNGSF